MTEETRPTRDPEVPYDEYQNVAFHPYNIMLMLVLFGICALFLAFSAAFIYSRVQSDLPPVKIPILFVFNTIILLGSSYTMSWAKKSYLADNTRNYIRALWWTTGLTFLFMLLQFVAWWLLFQQNIRPETDNSAGYLYVLSVMHFLHIIAGLPFLGVFIYQAYKHMREPVTVLVYFSDPDKRLKLRLLSIYWHFLDALWIYLVLFLFVNYLIQ